MKSSFQKYSARCSSLPRALLHLCALSVGALSICDATAAIPDSERAVLLSLYAETQGAGWFENEGWNGAAGSECSWYGVACDANETHVISISLPQNQLIGSLPETLADIQKIRVFDVSGNFLTGEIPPIATLGELQVFDVTASPSAVDNGYGLIGPVPGFPTTNQFRNFSASANRLSGFIPAFGSQLKELEIFDVSNNLLSGPIPSLDVLSSLEVFRAAGNQLDGSLPSLAGLTALREFNVAVNRLSGAIPRLSGLVGLVYFDVSHNTLSGSLPALTGLHNLTYFYVNTNNVSGPLPSLSGLSSVQEFSFCFNQVSGNIPSLSDMTQLVYFGGCYNRLSGEIPPIESLANLQVFHVHFNQLTGHVPAVAGLEHLVAFYVHENALEGPVPSLSGLPNLQGFGADHNRLSGQIPDLSGLTNIQFFFLDHNQLDGELPPLTGLVNLLYFGVESNRLSGPLPSLGGLVISRFTVGDNQFSGPPPIPAPLSLEVAQSSLCPNNLDSVPSFQWNSATGFSPWFDGCSAGLETIFSNGFDGA